MIRTLTVPAITPLPSPSRSRQAIEKEIVRIGDAVQSIREALQPQDDSHRLLAIKEDEREERANVEHNDVSSHSSAATESQCL